MTRLSLLFGIKIAFTVLVVAIPFVLLPSDRLTDVMGSEITNPTIYRLYGVATVALLVGYGFAIPAAQSGSFPTGPVAMGIVSNGGASVLLWATGPGGTSFVLTSVFTLIAALLVFSLFQRQVMLMTVSGKALARVPSSEPGDHR